MLFQDINQLQSWLVGLWHKKVYNNSTTLNIYNNLVLHDKSQPIKTIFQVIMEEVNNGKLKLVY